MDRRRFVACSMAFPIGSVSVATGAIASEPVLDVIPPLPSEFFSSRDSEPRNVESAVEEESTGTGAATSEQKELANSILSSAPKSTSPHKVAEYFDRLSRAGKMPERGYMRAWPRDQPANPVIVEFFRQTKTVPMGDETAWCAAFMNWCIARAQLESKNSGKVLPPTRSAASGSFRTWGSEVSLLKNGGWSQTPRIGDIVVFAQIEQDGRPHPTHGHVAFFAGQDGAVLYALGGNQFEGKPRAHCINTKGIRIISLQEAKSLRKKWNQEGRAGSILAVHSIRTDKSLHEIP